MRISVIKHLRDNIWHTYIGHCVAYHSDIFNIVNKTKFHETLNESTEIYT